MRFDKRKEIKEKKQEEGQVSLSSLKCVANKETFSSLLKILIIGTVFLWTTSCIATKIVAEEGRTGEVVLVCKVSKSDVRLQQVETDLHDCIDVYGFLW